MADIELATLVQSAENGNADDRRRLFAAFYAELHRIAQRELRRNAGATLSPTTLLHETFLSMSRNDAALFADQGRFMAYAARAMRGLLVDYIRNRQAQKRGGQFEITSLPVELRVGVDDVETEKLATALDELAGLHPRLAECVELKFFCGLSYDDIGKLWGMSERTVRREWDKARLLLHRLMTDQPLP